MKIKIKSNRESGVLVIGPHHIEDELIVDQKEIAQYATILANYKQLGWCSVSEVKASPKAEPKKVEKGLEPKKVAKTVLEPKKVEKPVLEPKKEEPKKRRRRSSSK